MRKLVLLTLLLATIGSYAQKKQALFNGNNLKGWEIFVENDEVAPEDYFYVKDGVIETVGIPLGYMRTKKKYANYKLHIEWRYPEKPVNSGIMLHTNTPDKIWISHYQAQLKHENAGDFIVHGVGISATVNGETYTSTEEEKPLIEKREVSSEKPSGEWNSYDIICNDETIEIRLNGVLQNVATNCSETKGSIGLQAENCKIQFRNLWIEKL